MPLILNLTRPAPDSAQQHFRAHASLPQEEDADPDWARPPQSLRVVEGTIEEIEDDVDTCLREWGETATDLVRTRRPSRD